MRPINRTGKNKKNLVITAQDSGYVGGTSAFAGRTDFTAPTLSSPSGTKTGQTTADLSVTTNEGNGQLYGVVTTSSTPPTKNQVKAGLDNSSVAAAFAYNVAVVSTGAKTKSVTGLAAGTIYSAHFMQEDAATNQSNVASSSTFTTDASNLLLQSKAFDNAVWTKENLTVSADAATAPDATNTADTVIEAADAAKVHRIKQGVTKAASAISYSLSVNAKAASGSRRLVVILSDSGVLNGVFVVFDIPGAQVGVAATPFGSGWTGGTASISSLGSGWLLCTLSGVTSDTTTTVEAAFDLDIGSGTGALQNSYDGGGTSGHNLWDAQLVTS